jgi:hypothetical protein
MRILPVTLQRLWSSLRNLVGTTSRLTVRHSILVVNIDERGLRPSRISLPFYNSTATERGLLC